MCLWLAFTKSSPFQNTSVEDKKMAMMTSVKAQEYAHGHLRYTKYFVQIVEVYLNTFSLFFECNLVSVKCTAWRRLLLFQLPCCSCTALKCCDINNLQSISHRHLYIHIRDIFQFSCCMYSCIGRSIESGNHTNFYSFILQSKSLIKISHIGTIHQNSPFSLAELEMALLLHYQRYLSELQASHTDFKVFLCPNHYHDQWHRRNLPHFWLRLQFCLPSFDFLLHVLVFLLCVLRNAAIGLDEHKNKGMQ